MACEIHTSPASESITKNMTRTLLVLEKTAIELFSNCTKISSIKTTLKKLALQS